MRAEPSVFWNLFVDLLAGFQPRPAWWNVNGPSKMWRRHVNAADRTAERPGWVSGNTLRGSPPRTAQAKLVARLTGLPYGRDNEGPRCQC